jgi:hypothetical protein
MTPVVYLFPDTNTFLEYRSFDEIDWSGLVDDAGVTLVIAHRPVVNELDRSKNNPNIPARKRDRAALALRKIAECQRAGRVNNRVAFEFWPNDPPATSGLDPSYPDNQLIMSVLHFMQERGVIAKIVSEDGGMHLRAPGFALQVISPPANAKHPIERDAMAVELQNLKQENEKLKSLRPRLSLAFSDGTQVLRVPMPNGSTLTDHQVDIEVSAEKWNLSALPLAEGTEEHLTKLEQYFRRKLEWDERVSHLVPVGLFVENAGQAPAADIDFTIDVPEGYAIVKTQGLEPVRPVYQYRSAADPLVPVVAPELLMSPLELISLNNDEEQESESRDSETERRAHYSLERLKQGRKQPLPPVVVQVPVGVLRPFSITATVTVGSPPHLEVCLLHVIPEPAPEHAQLQGRPL